MWSDELEKTNQSKVFRKFRRNLMNVGIEYGGDLESKNTRDRIAKGVPEE